MSFVLDSSVALGWCFRDEQTAETTRLLRHAAGHTIFVPALWHVEMANVLGIALRKQRLSLLDLELSLDVLRRLDIRTDTPVQPRGPEELIPLMTKFGLTAYDATYLELAMRLNLSLATFDSNLAVAARTTGVVLM